MAHVHKQNQADSQSGCRATRGSSPSHLPTGHARMQVHQKTAVSRLHGQSVLHLARGARVAREAHALAGLEVAVAAA